MRELPHHPSSATVDSVVPRPVSPRCVSWLAAVPSVVLLLVALVMPAACVAWTVIFFEERENEDLVTGIWTRETSSLYQDENYRYEIEQESDEVFASPTNFIVSSRRHDGGDILQADVWLEIVARFRDAQNSTRVTVGGVELNYQDICVNQEPYVLPCLRFTLLDCFAEGGYDFPEPAAAFWRGQVTDIITAMIPTLRAAIVDQALATPPAGPCHANCTFDGVHPTLSIVFPGQSVGTWPTVPACAACITEQRAFPTFAFLEDPLYYGALTALASTLADLAPPMMRGYILSLTAEDTTEWDALVEQLLVTVTGIEGQTPYTCDKIQDRLTCLPPVGGPRPQLQNASGAYLSAEEMRRTVSGNCFNWDDGQLLPSYNKYLYYGGVEPSIDAENITSMRAISSLFLLSPPEDIKRRVESTAGRPGGNVAITTAQAAEALADFKRAFEASMSRGWDDTSQRMRFTAFSDDIGAGGTFRTAMGAMNEESETTQLVFYCTMPFLSALLFIQCFRNPAVESRSALAFFANIIVYLGIFAALGVTAREGTRINIVHYGILPFLLVGLGLDDAYIVVMAADNAIGATPEERFVRAMMQVINPVLMTSCVNTIQFMVLWVVCDVGALYKVALTGWLACSIQCLNIVTSLMPLVLLDLRRSYAGRCDVLCCLRRSAAPSGDKNTSITFHELVYKRFLNNVVAKAVVLLMGLVLLVVACVRLGDLPVGLSLEDFFSPDTQGAAYSADQAEFFPTWPVSIYFGEIQYSDPSVQMRIASMFEKVQSSRYVTSGLPTTFVWTAALAQWAIPSAFGLPNSPCLATNQLTGGDCGEAHGCAATFEERGFDLQLFEQPGDVGFCYRGETLINSLDPGDTRAAQFESTRSYCPTFQWNSTEFRRCYMNWTATPMHGFASPNIRMEADGPQLPIRVSAVRGNNLFFSYGTFNSEDYVNLIEETRAHVDDDEDVHAWMSGSAFLFWEQYSTVLDFTFEAGAWSVAFGVLCSFLFLMVEFTLQYKAVPCTRKLAIALLSSLLIGVLCSISMLITVGICGWFDIKFSVFTSGSCVFSTGFIVEYVVHIIHYYVEATGDTPTARIQSVMKRLAWPTFIAFISTMISLCMLLIIDVRFMTIYFFGPLCVACLVTFFLGVLFLPSLLGLVSIVPALYVKDGTGSRAGGEGGGAGGEGGEELTI